MKKLAWATALSLSLSLVDGCASTQSMYGNYSMASSNAARAMASSSVEQLKELFSPAQTTIDMKQEVPATDSFGTSLLQQLRGQGYSVIEYSSNKQQGDNREGVNLPLGYVVDQPAGGLYRVTMRIGVQSISRAFSIGTNGAAVPAGSWVRQE